MAGTARSQQEAQGDSRPAPSLRDPEEEEPGGLRASVWPWSLWASLSRASMLPTWPHAGSPWSMGSPKSMAWGWGPKLGVLGWRRPTLPDGPSGCPTGISDLPCPEHFSRVLPSQTPVIHGTVPLHLARRTESSGSLLPPAPLGLHPTGQSQLLHPETGPSPGPPRAVSH